jgi:peptidoglycan/LPS O-acetylase OafA/YrhL
MSRALARLRYSRRPWLALLVLVVLLVYPLPAFAGAPADSTGSVVTSTTLWGLVVGLVTPPIVAIIQKPGWSSRTRSLVGVGVALVFAVGTCWVDGSIGHGQTLITTFGAVLVASQTTYRELWSKIGATQAIEKATSGATTEGAPGDSQADVAPPRSKSRRGG